MAWAPKGGAGKKVELSPHDVAERVAGQSVSRKQDYVEQEHERADAHSDSPVKKEGAKRVAPEEDEEDESDIEKVAMEVLKNEGKFRFTPIAVSAFTNGACRRVEKKSPVIRLAVVVASDPESQRE